jgi:hypothetical protein
VGPAAAVLVLNELDVRNRKKEGGRRKREERKRK